MMPYQLSMRHSDSGLQSCMRDCNTRYHCMTKTKTKTKTHYAVTYEAEVVQELLAASSVLNKAMVWSETEVKLNLHGFSITSAYVLMLQWVDAVRGGRACPLEVSVVCGVGKHSDVRGEPKVRELAQEVLSRMGSPLRLSARNKGRLVAKRDRVKQWLATEWTSVVAEESTDQPPYASDQQPFLPNLLRKLGQFFSHLCQFPDEWQAVYCRVGGSKKP
ncbi:pentatricopeptide repeat-containing protein [Hordeum vulgare]|nr:pentatricopeptide repeat-containing protein [Hordeum vulgare]